MTEHEELLRSRKELLRVVRRRDDEIERLRAALREISGYTAEPKLYDHEEDMSDRLDSIYKVIEEALGDE